MIRCLFQNPFSISENSVEGRMTRELWVSKAAAVTQSRQRADIFQQGMRQTQKSSVRTAGVATGIRAWHL